jgi:LuxR family maltose regulon positive regulatory protein
LAEPGGYVRTFLEEGQPMAELLAQALQRGIAPGYAAEILAAFDAQSSRFQVSGSRTATASPSSLEPEPPSPGPREPEPLLEPLSPRETEVMGLIAEGASNPQIAEQLYISVNTVKKHVTNIFGKLSVSRRTEAVARARDLGIVE